MQNLDDESPSCPSFSLLLLYYNFLKTKCMFGKCSTKKGFRGILLTQINAPWRSAVRNKGVKHPQEFTNVTFGLSIDSPTSPNFYLINP